MMLLLVGLALAHPLAPSGLVIDLDDGVTTAWRTPASRPAGVALAPRLPADCVPLDAPIVREEPATATWTTTQRWDCGAAGLLGREVVVDGLRGAPVAVVATVRLDGAESRALLHDNHDRLVVRAPDAAPAPFPAYLALGVTHLLGGWDHLLLVLGLLLLLGSSRSLIAAVTAFTAGHSLTLALAATGLFRLPQAPVEALIAGTLVWLGVELSDPERGRGWIARRPAALCAVIGLVHGLGFAGALAETGLPAGAALPALFGFNLGLELAQLGVLAGALAAWRLTPAPLARRLGPALPGWAIGIVAAAWTWDRLLGVFGA